MELTNEQSNILDHKDSLIVVARAGAGKSSTIRLMAEKYKENSLYLVYNKALQMEAEGKLPSNVKVKTIHSLAYGQYGTKIRHKLNKGDLATSEQAIESFKIPAVGTFDRSVMYNLIKMSLDRFESGTGYHVDKYHVPKKYLVKALGKENEELTENENKLVNDAVEVAVDITQRWYDRRSDTKDKAIASHNTYLKMYQLSKPILKFDRVYVDEGQDMQGSFLEILKRQIATTVIVGDDKQAIYGWNGAVDSLTKFNFDKLNLTQSFRFGQPIADIAKICFEYPINIKGYDKIKSEIGVVDKSKYYSHIFRTNESLLSTAVMLMADNKKVEIEVNARDLIGKLESISMLLNGKKPYHPMISIYSDRDILEKAIETDLSLGLLYRLVTQGRSRQIVDTLRKYKKPSKPDVTLCTAHKSKGREWRQVILDDDFREPYKKDNDGVVRYTYSREDENLLYVAATRAMNKLQINSAIVDLQNKSY